VTDVTTEVPRVRPHPRIRERRVAVKRNEGRRRLRILVLAVTAVALVGAGYGATRSPLLDVDTVRVRGASETEVAAVLAASGLDRSPAMVDLDERAIERAIAALPWVASVDVVVDYPGTVEVTLLERTPIATLSAGEGVWALVDIEGRVLQHIAEPVGELTRVEAPPAGGPGTTVDESTRAALRLIDALPEVLAGRVPGVTVDATGALRLHLDGKIPVELGRATDVEAKLVALATLVQKADLARVRIIDVRVPTAPVLTRG
jgi:cell division protein FtsQ